MKLNILNSKNRVFALHLFGWGVILGTTIFWGVGRNSDRLDTFALANLTITILELTLIYIMNYTLFIPRFLFREQKSRFFVANVFLIVFLLCISYSVSHFELLISLRPEGLPPRPRAGYMFLARDLINYVLMIGLVMALRLAEKLQSSEEALREAESARVQAELANLRSQINPHFLLNTLNNIYALTTIDTDKAQKTIKELSNLLRYILYDNMNDKVLVVKEVEFLKTYIELMSIRLPRKVLLNTEFRLSPNSTTQIAPLIFISLIENAFKHSIDANGEGFIEILFVDDVERGEVVLSIKNSNNAKRDEDKSGHGIGLGQVKRRLELLYKGQYVWEVSGATAIYTSRLTLHNKDKVSLK